MSKPWPADLQFHDAGDFWRSIVLGTAKLIFQTPRVATIKSGTDGWRTAIAEDFKFANDALVAQAAADLKV